MPGDTGGLSNILRRSETRDDVLSLCIEQELAVKFLRPG